MRNSILYLINYSQKQAVQNGLNYIDVLVNKRIKNHLEKYELRLFGTAVQKGISM
jgi:hypothetical protein